ncbi:MAG: MgtC/SapB family protein [Lacrimispora sphenoides]|uniref:Mg2+ transporter-C (MgtC) family protein n=2 Tax=Lacrimispora TaxID=2719231 RepID=A0ABY1C9U7_9FIRM|nr:MULTISPECIES: MgtC/SapB family protein [Lacrimispora]MDR7811092.1 MgtC/SapB family protein [Lacrimispora sp.]SET83325.1 putative Mg2+ transporter-C (MgtC) family protein [[Clostridium] sphenoides JCM 1415]SEU13062.1 putative Mg2+ transporter-C (MgtC) family protein [Lacrimispora sphenoides]SUY51626.1 MgtC/SapB transporter [Lacrimispora sphenoides]
MIHYMLSQVNIASIAFRLFLSIILCGAIGMERGLRNRPAGFMTYLLVGCGSALIMITNQYIATIYTNVDPTRMASQVVSGIGFLGAGTIITTAKNEIRGLTTAAGLWAAAAVGLAVGIGFYGGAIIGSIFIIFSLMYLKKIDLYIKTHAKTMEIYLEYNEEFSMQNLSLYTEQSQYEIFDMEAGKIKTLNGEFGTLTFDVNFRHKVNHVKIIEEIRQLPGILYVREVA